MGDCAGTFTKECVFKCNDGFASVDTSCNMDGMNNWSTPTKQTLKTADCSKCDTVPTKYKIKGEGRWTCENVKTKKVCSITCDNGVVPDFGVHCSRTKARNNWSINKRKKGAASCEEIKVCDATD